MTPEMQKIRDDLAKAFNMPNDFKVGFDAAVKLMQEREKVLIQKILDEVHAQAIMMYESDIDTDSSELIFVEIVLDKTKEALSKIKEIK